METGSWLSYMEFHSLPSARTFLNKTNEWSEQISLFSITGGIPIDFLQLSDINKDYHFTKIVMKLSKNWKCQCKKDNLFWQWNARITKSYFPNVCCVLFMWNLFFFCRFSILNFSCKLQFLVNFTIFPIKPFYPYSVIRSWFFKAFVNHEFFGGHKYKIYNMTVYVCYYAAHLQREWVLIIKIMYKYIW